MRLRRLGWAGLELESGGESIVVDHLLDPGILGGFFGEERDELITPAPGQALGALLTHLHRDHADVAAIEAAVTTGGTVLRPARKSVESAFDEVATGEPDAALDASALDVRSCTAGDSFEIGPFTLTALPAADGLGAPQVSWAIEADDQTVVHAGDTIWHSGWWDIALAHGPIDIAFLPANGAEISYPGLDPAVSVPAVMPPEQAVEAAYALQARLLIPIHHNRTFEHPDYYRPRTDAAERITELAADRNLEVAFLEPGEWGEVGAVTAAA